MGRESEWEEARPGLIAAGWPEPILDEVMSLGIPPPPDHRPILGPEECGCDGSGWFEDPPDWKPYSCRCNGLRSDQASWRCFECGGAGCLECNSTGLDELHDHG